MIFLADIRRPAVVALLLLAFGSSSAIAQQTSSQPSDSIAIQLPRLDPLVLVPSGQLGQGAKIENSGIVRSRQHADLFWTQNDSGDEPRIYPIRRNGEIYPSERYLDSPGVLIGGAINVDWEDIAVDAEGHVIVADLGNNGNDRRDLVLYYLDEPAPTAGRTTYKKKVFFRYPDQTEFPAPKSEFNYDSEAIFTLGTTVYVLSKHRSDSFTKLYRLDRAEPFVTNTLTYVDRFDIRGQAVGADATPDGKRLVIVTYEAIWLFDIADPNKMFSGPIHWLPIKAEQVEAICFADDKTLLLADEVTAAVYEVPLERLVRVQ